MLTGTPQPQSDWKHWITVAQLQAEKCELREARTTFETAYELARSARDVKGMMESISGLLRINAEALDREGIQKWDETLDELLKTEPQSRVPAIWLGKGAVLFHLGRSSEAQRFIHQYLREIQREPELDIHQYLKAWVILVACLRRRGRIKRAELTAQLLLSRYEKHNARGVNGYLYLMLGDIEEHRQDLSKARKWYQKAYASFLGEHNWYYHLYALISFAALARQEHNYTEAAWYLDLVQKAASGPEFGAIRRLIEEERKRLEQDTVDLIIDARQAVVTTVEQGEIQLGKQHVLIQILEALTRAHEKEGSDTERGLSKADIIKLVWGEEYRPESHDNKLYYNINRLRRLLETDMKNPKYVINWKEGYRLAPGLKVHFIGQTLSEAALENVLGPTSAGQIGLTRQTDSNIAGVRKAT